jgi:pimeloyl-ACP methyl ester carboxylesterase
LVPSVMAAERDSRKAFATVCRRSSQTTGSLPRRGLLGLGLSAEVPGLVTRVADFSAASELGIAAGTRIATVDGEEVRDAKALRTKLAGLSAGAIVRFGIRVEGRIEEVAVPVRGRPLEEPAGCETIYSDFECGPYRLRAIVTVPEHTTKAVPFVLFVPGQGTVSLEGPARPARSPEPPLSAMAAEIARSGVAFIRFDRSSVGDSEGPSTERVTLKEELQQLQRAWSFARSLPFVAPQRGTLLAHSLGMVPATKLAVDARDTDARPAGLMIYGGGLKTWTEYLDENSRRQWTLRGIGPVDQDRLLRRLQRFHALALVLRTPVSEITTQMPEIRDNPELFGIEPEGVLRGRPESYWQDVYHANTPEEVRDARIPILAAWGQYDWLASREDHELIVACANETSTGRGEFFEVPGADHYFAARSSVVESFRSRDMGVLASALPKALGDWARKR